MIYRNQECKRLWKVKVYTGDPNTARPRTRTETVIAWNAVGATRKAGGAVATPPEQVCFVWSDNDEPPWYRIESTAGPTEEVVEPTIS